jgi:hypothetical protein
VVEAVGEVVGEELHGDAELTVGSVGWGNNQRTLPCGELLMGEDDGGGNPVARLR